MEWDGLLGKNRIVGGVASKTGIPFQAAIFVSGNQRCGGVILDQKTILSSAHCIRSSYTDLKHF